MQSSVIKGMSEEKARERIFTVEKLDKHDLRQLFKSTSAVTRHVDVMWYDVKRRTHHLCGFSPKTYSVSLIMRKPSGKYKLRGILQKSSPVPLETVKVIQTPYKCFSKLSRSLKLN